MVLVDGTELAPSRMCSDMRWQWLPLPWSKAGLGSETTLSSACVHTLIGSGSLPLSGEQCWHKRGWSRSPLWAAGLAGVVQEGQPEPRAVFKLL